MSTRHNNKVRLIFLLIFLLPLMCFSAVVMKWQTRSVILSPAAPKIGDSVEFSSSFVVNSSKSNLIVNVRLDRQVLLRKQYGSVAKDVPIKVTAKWKATAGNHRVVFVLGVKGGTSRQNSVIDKRFTVGRTLMQPTRIKATTKPQFATLAKKPDLIVSSLHMVYLQVDQNSSLIKIWLRVKNEGQGASTEGKYRISIDGLSSIYFPEVKNYWKESTHILFGLSPGLEYNYGHQTHLSSGKYRCVIFLDVNDDSKESDENNNREILEFNIVKKSN